MKTYPTFWLLARASGLTAYGLLTASVLAGLVLKARPFGRALKPAATADVHRFLTLLGLGMLVLHGGTLMLDRTLRMPLAGLFVPGASVPPDCVGAGVVGSSCSSSPNAARSSATLVRPRFFSNSKTLGSIPAWSASSSMIGGLNRILAVRTGFASQPSDSKTTNSGRCRVPSPSGIQAIVLSCRTKAASKVAVRVW